MFKTLEEIMYITDGINPFGNGLGYKPILGTGKSMNEIYKEKYIDKSNDYTNVFTPDYTKVKTLDEYIDEEEEKINEEENKILKDYYNENNNKDIFYYNMKKKNNYYNNTNIFYTIDKKNMKGNGFEKIGQTEEEYDETMKNNKDILQNIGNEKLIKHYFDTLELRDTDAKDQVLDMIEYEFNKRGINKDELIEPKYNYEIGKTGEKEQDLYYYADINSTNDKERGDETEVILDEYIPDILTKIDNDNTKIYNSKIKDNNIWNREFISNVSDIDLTFFPIDAIKNNTLWEFKSYKDPLKKSVKLADTKIDGTKEYDIIFKNYKEKGGVKTKIENIYFKGKNDEFKDNPIPTLIHNPKGYDYYIAFNLRDKLGYYKPLEDENFSFYVDGTNLLKEKLLKNKIINNEGEFIKENINDKYNNEIKLWEEFKLTNEPIYIKKKDKTIGFKSIGTMDYSKLKGFGDNRDKEYILDKSKISYLPKRYIKKFGNKYINKFIEKQT